MLTVFSQASSRRSSSPSSSSHSFCYLSSEVDSVEGISTVELFLKQTFSSSPSRSEHLDDIGNIANSSKSSASSHSQNNRDSPDSNSQNNSDGPDSHASTTIHQNNASPRPPTTVVLDPSPSMVPYAQLYYHKEQQTLSTMLVGTAKHATAENAPRLTLSAQSDDENDDEEESGSGWSTGYSSNDSSYELSDYKAHQKRGNKDHPLPQGVVWVSREWWTRDDNDEPWDDQALLPDLRLSRSGSSGEDTATAGSASAAVAVSLKSCGKLFCNLRHHKQDFPHGAPHSHGPTRNHVHPKYPFSMTALTTSFLYSRSLTALWTERHNKTDDPWYGYQLLEN